MRKSQREYIDDFVKLVAENPDLNVMPLVEADIVCDGDGLWRGAIGESYVDEYFHEDERIYIKSKDIDELADIFIDNRSDDKNFMEMQDEDIWDIAVKEVEEYEWTKAIMLRIDTP